MNSDPELAAMAAVLSALQNLEPDTQARVVKWAVDKLGLTVKAPNPMRGSTGSGEPDESGANNLPPAVNMWLKQNDVSLAEVESVFQINETETSVIAAQIPGSNNKERVLNCYLLSGIGEFVRTGNAIFTDKPARELCAAFGCLDTTNHSKTLNGKGNEFTGSKDKGWALTVPGKKRGAALVKEIAKSA